MGQGWSNVIEIEWIGDIAHSHTRIVAIVSVDDSIEITLDQIGFILLLCHHSHNIIIISDDRLGYEFCKEITCYITECLEVNSLNNYVNRQTCFIGWLLCNLGNLADVGLVDVCKVR